jgi:ABC-type sugar transport system ATPase subunit
VPANTLETVDIRKEYPGTIALDGVSLRFNGGEIHALIGKNGAGKSTLLKIFSGAVQPGSGSILLNGTPVQLHSPRDALAKGIAAVYQELSLVPELTVAENIFLGRLPHREGPARAFIDWPGMFSRARGLLGSLGITMDVTRKASALGVAQQQIVEIAKAMSHEPAVLMLDEPTSALAHHETEHLFTLLRQLVSRGVVLIYITHRLQEIKQIAHTVSVLRNGKLAGTLRIEEASPQTVAHMMFGETVQKVIPRGLSAGKETAMEVRNLTRAGAFTDISFAVHRGEILGIAGLLGSGRTELLRAIFGADPPDAGEVMLDGNAVRPATPRQMRKLGIALAPENRKDEGLVQILSTRLNTCLASLPRIARHGFTTRRRETAVTRRSIDEVAITVADVEAPVSSLSGGNQQKVVVGKWLNTEPRVMLFDEPTRGIDIQAKQQMFQLLWDLSRKGISSVVVSSELEELMDICHRILVMRKGSIVGEVVPQSATLEQLFALCLGDGEPA